jgi:hypothetical protein
MHTPCGNLKSKFVYRITIPEPENTSEPKMYQKDILENSSGQYEYERNLPIDNVLINGQSIVRYRHRSGFPVLEHEQEEG